MGSINWDWSWVVPWLLFLGALIYAIRNAYAAERDRRALQQVDQERHKLDLENEKLELEVARLRNSPEVVAEKREIYESLRAVLQENMASGNATPGQIGRLFRIKHDATFRYPDEVVDEIDGLISNAMNLHTTHKMTESGRLPPGVDDEEWRRLSQQHHDAQQALCDYYEAMTEKFKPYLSL